MPTADGSLAGLRVLVTRPASQAGGLADLVRRAGGEPILFPTLEIKPAEPSTAGRKALERAGVVIFVSPNAVVHGYRFLQQADNPGVNKQVIAIGHATRSALEQQGCPDVHEPAGPETSESLLDLPLLGDVHGHRVCIVRGRGGRELLRQTLESRGARVDYLECYQRGLPQNWDPQTLPQALSRETDTLVVTATSVAGLLNLLDMTPARYRRALTGCVLVVIGGRQITAAREKGWRGPVLAAGAGDEHMIETVRAWRRGARTR